ncbi:hypothetical protein DPMN_127239 [Dreissena polymorpha]|uniref:Uncharacterized protein n=1 Tax=Dreissena polymorpha TaxID=45954 RepID=A0A9D4JWC1_DREPO|nr:hypothetical protein DPMN_127239 [Dreissena polymorpha]
MAIDWIMRRTTEGRRQGIQWTLTSPTISGYLLAGIKISSRRHNSWHCQQAP